MANPFVHVELHTNDVARVKDFYSRLFSWKLQDVPMPGGGSYTMIDVGGGTGDDIHASTRKAKDLGAKVVVDVTEVGEYGTMSVITDPTGATVAMWQPKGK